MIHPSLADICTIRGRSYEAMCELLDTMLDDYKEQLLTAKPERLVEIQCFARQVKQLRQALEDPNTHRPTL